MEKSFCFVLTLACITTLFTVVINAVKTKASVLVTAIHFHPSLIFVGMNLLTCLQLERSPI